MELLKNPIRFLSSNWVISSLIQKLIYSFIIVFMYGKGSEIVLIIMNLVFMKIFFFMKPIKNKIAIGFCIIIDLYVILVIILHKYSIISIVLWPIIIVINVFMIGEDAFT